MRSPGNSLGLPRDGKPTTPGVNPDTTPMEGDAAVGGWHSVCRKEPVMRQSHHRLIDFLETQAIPYQVRFHAQPPYPAQQESSFLRLPGSRVAKMVVVMPDERPAMFVLPADH